MNNALCWQEFERLIVALGVTWIVLVVVDSIAWALPHTCCCISRCEQKLRCCGIAECAVANLV